MSVSNASGRDISLIENMNLYNGYFTSTEETSYAWISLDSERLGRSWTRSVKRRSARTERSWRFC